MRPRWGKDLLETESPRMRGKGAEWLERRPGGSRGASQPPEEVGLLPGAERPGQGISRPGNGVVRSPEVRTWRLEAESVLRVQGRGHGDLRCRGYSGLTWPGLVSLGAGRGRTSPARLLAHHPECCVPRRKELEGQTGRMTIQFGLVGCQGPMGHTSRGAE